MSQVMHIQNMPLDYAEVVRRVISDGMYTCPRGKATYELQDVTLMVYEPWHALPIGTGRKLNLGIGAVEALQLIAGTARPKLLLQISPHFEQFFEGNRMYGMYGERIANQLNSVVQKLCDDPDTRQAVITLWRPDWDNDMGHKDYPCTIGMQFRIRHGYLNMSTIMRSNDVILGLAYDIFQFTQLQITIANLLGFEVGTYAHHALSLHFYETDLEIAEQLHTSSTTLRVDGISGDEIWVVRDRARRILDALPLENETPGEEWYRTQLDKARARG